MQDGAALDLSDATVASTQGRASDGTEGRGLSVQFGASAIVTRAIVRNNREIGVYAGEEGTATLSDVVIRDTSAQNPARPSRPAKP